MAGVRGSGGSVAIEQMSGELAGRLGTFILQHKGSMARGAPSFPVSVVPDSGTDDLAGLAFGAARDVTRTPYALGAASGSAGFAPRCDQCCRNSRGRALSASS